MLKRILSVIAAAAILAPSPALAAGTSYTTKILNGKEGKDYATLLTERHNAYIVRGRITDTSRSSGLRKGYVKYQVEVSDNFDGIAYSSKNAETFQVRVGDVNMTDWLFIYNEALIQKEDMTDEYVMLTIRAK